MLCSASIENEQLPQPIPIPHRHMLHPPEKRRPQPLHRPRQLHIPQPRHQLYVEAIGIPVAHELASVRPGELGAAPSGWGEAAKMLRALPPSRSKACSPYGS